MLIQLKLCQMPRPLGRVQDGLLLRLVQDMPPQDEHVHVGRHEASIGVLGRTDDRLAANIETRIDQHRTAGLLWNRVSNRCKSGLRSCPPSAPGPNSRRASLRDRRSALVQPLDAEGFGTLYQNLLS